MDNLRFGAFVAQLRKEKQWTQQELADRLHVTDKAISKWETGKGFPEVTLLEPLAQALEVSLVELLQGERNPSPTLTKEEAGRTAVRAMEEGERRTARRYLKLLRWLLVAIGVGCLLSLILWLGLGALLWQMRSTVGVIGGADGPTAILVSSTLGDPPLWLSIGLPLVVLVACVVLVIRVRRVERSLR